MQNILSNTQNLFLTSVFRDWFEFRSVRPFPSPFLGFGHLELPLDDDGIWRWERTVQFASLNGLIEKIVPVAPREACFKLVIIKLTSSAPATSAASCVLSTEMSFCPNPALLESGFVIFFMISRRLEISHRASYTSCFCSYSST